MRLYRLGLALLWGVSLYVFAQCLAEGWPYYATPLLERPRHELYWALKPGGRRGLLYGMVGTAMMIVMLLYSVRKRWGALRRAGRLSIWLDLHIYLGAMGPLWILLHTSFKVGGLVAISFWSMVLVATSGVLGRYLYLQVLPRAAEDLGPRERQRRRRMQTAFHYWHVFHKPFAAVMYLLMIVHVAVAYMTGYGFHGGGG